MMKHYPHDQTYRNLAMRVFLDGERHNDRTGVGTRSLFGEQMRFDLRDGFPLLTTKRLFTKGIIAELLWMLSGDTNVRALQAQGVHIWDEWADEHGDLGLVYGAQWRRWDGGVEPWHPHDGYQPYPTIDQIANVIEAIRTNPNSRRHIVTAWNPADIETCALPPCHCFFQFNVKGEFLDCQLYQRSADLFLGVPFNIASYAILMSIIAHVCDLCPRYFVHTFGDVHIYTNHLDQIGEQISRDSSGPMPQLELSGPVELFDECGGLLWTPDMIKVRDYQPAPAIKAPVAV